MPLVLTLHRARDPVDRQRESRTLGEGSLSIGRGTGNGWVLQDPAQHLSKQHCVVTAGHDGYVLTDCSSNGVFLNGARMRMPRDSQVPLGDGDEFVIGDYLIQARVVADLSGRSIAAVAAAPARGMPPAIEQDDPFGLNEFLASPSPPPKPVFDPFADPALARRVDPFGEDDELLAPVRMHQPFEPLARPHAVPLPDTFDAHTPRHDDPFGPGDDLFGGVAPSVQWEGPSQPDGADAAHGAFQLPKVIAPAAADEWDDLLGDMPLAAPSLLAAAPAPLPASAPADGDPGRLLAAFLAGAGVPGLDISKHDPEASLRAAGELFGLMVESLRDVLMSRAAVKREFGLEQTMLRPRENNALKFSLTPADAVAALLQPNRPGYMPPLRATREAFDDVRMHQVAVMAGVQAALFNLLRSFDPAVLEARLQKGGMIESLLPATRRAKLWEAFVLAYKDIAHDADSDFQDVFGREFTRAYSKQAKTG